AEGHALRNEPPVIIFSTKPAMLILIDGPPAFRAVDGTDLERVVNTRALVLRDKAGRHYLHLFDGYVTAPGLGGPWTVLQTPGRELEKARKEAVDTAQVDLLAGREDPDTRKMPSLKTSPVPALYFATTPTELV